MKFHGAPDEGRAWEGVADGFGGVDLERLLALPLALEGSVGIGSALALALGGWRGELLESVELGVAVWRTMLAARDDFPGAESFCEDFAEALRRRSWYKSPGEDASPKFNR